MTYEHLWHTYGTFYTHLGGGVNRFSVCGMYVCARGLYDVCVLYVCCEHHTYVGCRLKAYNVSNKDSLIVVIELSL